MISQFRRVHQGARWVLQFGAFHGVERTAVIELQKILQYYLPYVLEVVPAADAKASDGHEALIGTVASNPRIAALVASGEMQAPVGDEGYSLLLRERQGKSTLRQLVVAGADERGVLYGAVEAALRLFGGGTLLDGFGGKGFRGRLDEAAPFAVCERPAVRQRGLWTWGYPITDYRRYLDNMMRLKLNTLILWNDCPPWNMAEILDYAHTRGIRVILGFHWGWGHSGSLDISKAEDRRHICEAALKTYRTDYAALNHDGIYFQTLTEHGDLLLAGQSTAAWVTTLVNETASALLQEFPDLQIQCGLHGTAIKEHYTDLAALNSRVEIVWEDCASQVPFSYYPAAESPHLDSFEKSLDYSRKLATFRTSHQFAFVAKVWSFIRWQDDFENHGSFILGEQATLHAQERLLLRQGEWDRINAHWLEHYPIAAQFYRDILHENPNLGVYGLVEDGLFETRIQPSVTLFGETLWNPFQSNEEILRRALRPAYQRLMR